MIRNVDFARIENPYRIAGESKAIRNIVVGLLGAICLVSAGTTIYRIGAAVENRKINRALDSLRAERLDVQNSNMNYSEEDRRIFESYNEGIDTAIRLIENRGEE